MHLIRLSTLDSHNKKKTNKPMFQITAGGLRKPKYVSAAPRLELFFELPSS